MARRPHKRSSRISSTGTTPVQHAPLAPESPPPIAPRFAPPGARTQLRLRSRDPPPVGDLKEQHARRLVQALLEAPVPHGQDIGLLHAVGKGCQLLERPGLGVGIRQVLAAGPAGADRVGDLGVCLG